jgi:hypothetical protein
MKPKYFLLLLLTLLIVNSSLLITHATVRFVSKSGTSTPPYTSWETAADSIQKCINVCVDGDTVYVANGVYKEFLVINPSISLFGMSMDSTVIDGRGLGPYYTVRANADQTIAGFKIIGKGFGTDTSYTVISTNRHNLNVLNCKISNANNGIYISSSSGLLSDLLIDNVNIGITTFCGYDTCKPVIKNSVIIVRPGSGIGIENFHQGQPTIKNNIILATQYETSSGIRNVIELKKLIVENNEVAGFMLNVDVGVTYDTVKVINNLIRDYNSTNTGLGAIYGYDGTEKTIIRNNILFNNRIGIRFTGDPNSDYNLYWANEINVTNGTALGDSDIFADPMFVKDTLAYTQTGNYHLQKYSPAIDAGDPNILDVDGSRSDIGMYGGPFGESYKYQDLPPKAPKNFQASYDSGVVTITWDKNSAADFSYYNIYRSTTYNFEPDSTNYYSLVDTAFFRDTTTITNGKLYYRITAVDSLGNESVPGEQITVTITGIDEGEVEIVGEYKLYQNFPNPFNPTTIIPFKLKERGYVKVMVYDIKGELLKVLVNETREAGYYETEFNGSGFASGIYLYRIEVIGEGNIPAYMEMEKMMLIK